jgi:glycosyltransferase involved in cell wall biosynthesis
VADPAVSVLVPTWNGAAHLAACLESLLAQEFRDMEILVSDDCSSDSTPSVIRAFADRDARIRWWVNDRNLGMAGNFNSCLDRALGRFIKPLLQDDVLVDPSAIARMVAVLDSEPGVALVGCASILIDQHGREIGRRRPFAGDRRIRGRRLIVDCLERAENIIGEPSLVMFRRADAGVGLDAGFRQLIDQELHFRLLEQGDFVFIDQVLAAFRRHEAQLSALHARSDISLVESRRLFQAWYRKEWMRESATRAMLFTQLRRLKRYHAADSAAEHAELMRDLGRGWFAALWIRRRLERLLRHRKG